jgi:hypothetical protein
MTEIEQLKKDIQHLKDLEAIKTLKARYIRTMILSQWQEMETLLTEDVEASYSDGKYVFNGRQNLMKFLTDLHDATGGDNLAYWVVCLPEIDLTSAVTAKGTWAMQSYNLNKSHNMEQRQFAYYHDDYVKVDGVWKISRTTYQRVLEEEHDRSGDTSYNLTVGG